MKSRSSIITATIITIAVGWGAMWWLSNGLGKAVSVASNIYANNGREYVGSVSDAMFSIFRSEEKHYSDIGSDTQKALLADAVNDATDDSKNNKDNNAATISVEKSDDTIVVMIGGDMMFDRGVRIIGEKYSYDSLFGSIAPIFKQADIIVANLEGPITDNPSETLLKDGSTGDSFKFTFSPKAAASLANAGFTAVSLANNHSDNFGMKGIEETRNYLENAGVKYFGTPWNEKSSESVICKNGICVALVGYHAFQKGFDNIVARVRELSAKNYFVIVMPHWGEEYVTKPSEKMRDQARTFIAAGAKAVIGAHTHVIGENEWLGEAPVYYSLGNLIFDQYFSPETMKGLVVELFIKKTENAPVLDHLKTIEVSNESMRGITISSNR